MTTPLKDTSNRGIKFIWCLYDFANSAFPTVIITAVYVLYFKNTVVGDANPGRSDNLWGAAISIGAALVFFTAPLLGAAADLAGRKQAFLTGFSLICIAATGLLYFTGSGTVGLAMILIIIAVVGFESSLVFYNAFLPELTTVDKMGLLSGKGWALGYLGGLGCLLVIIPIAESHIRLVPPIVAIWYLVFAIPSFMLLKDRKKPPIDTSGPSALALGAKRLTSTLREIGKHRSLVRFLTSYFFYNNAVTTIIVFAVAFSSETLAFTMKESILLVTAMNIVASPGALGFGWLADRIGAKTTLVITLVMWLVVVAGAEVAAWPGLFTQAGAKSFFWVVAIMASLCIGAVQATSRAFVGQMSPDGHEAEFYGFMAFAGKGSAVLGPLVFGLTSDLFDNQRAAVASIGLFFLIGLVLLARVPALRVQGKGGT